MNHEFIEDLIQLLELEPQAESGSDDFVFGNYVEFPAADQIDRNLIPEVLDLLGVPLPFTGEATASSLRWLPTLDSSTTFLALRALGEPTVSMTEVGEFFLSFPDLNSTSERTLELVDHLLPPTQYEYELPPRSRYWQPDPEDFDQDPDDELLNLYRSSPVTLDTLVGELESLRMTIKAICESTVQKAILLACFSLVESFTRQRALLNAPRLPNSPAVEHLVLKLLRREVENDGRRLQVVKALEPGKSWKRQIPAWQLRNALAHDIGSVVIAGGEISYRDASRKIQKQPTDNVFDALIKYANENLG